jgi:hypothetical protein
MSFEDDSSATFLLAGPGSSVGVRRKNQRFCDEIFRPGEYSRSGDPLEI